MTRWPPSLAAGRRRRDRCARGTTLWLTSLGQPSVDTELRRLGRLSEALAPALKPGTSRTLPMRDVHQRPTRSLVHLACRSALSFQQPLKVFETRRPYLAPGSEYRKSFGGPAVHAFALHDQEAARRGLTLRAAPHPPPWLRRSCDVPSARPARTARPASMSRPARRSRRCLPSGLASPAFWATVQPSRSRRRPVEARGMAYLTSLRMAVSRSVAVRPKVSAVSVASMWNGAYHW
ncbi:hypothetical protein BXY51_008544 [Actinoplanes cyaneus]|nr:hypothetical protein [Actinoplanes cyaneus]